MQRVFERPKVTYTVLVVLLVALFTLSGVGNGLAGSDDVAWIGTIGWIGFALTFVATIAFSLALLVRTARRRRSMAT